MKAGLLALVILHGQTTAEEGLEVQNVLQSVPAKRGVSEAFFPIGLSDAGRLAFIEVRAVGPKACLRWAFVVQNLVDDRILARIAQPDGEACFNPRSVSKLLQQRGPELRAQLQKHGIDPRHRVQLSPFPLKHQGAQVHARLEVGEPTTARRATKTRLGVVLWSPGRGDKTVGVVEELQNGLQKTVFDHQIAGALSRQGVDRTAVVVRSQRLSRGGALVFGFQLFGTSLKDGFIPSDLAKIERGLKANNLVAVTYDSLADRARWCRAGKPTVREAIRAGDCSTQGPKGCELALDPAPVQTRRLFAMPRDESCQGQFFHLRTSEWTFATEADAKRAVERIENTNHDRGPLKSVHRTWRSGRRVYFVYSGELMSWDRFDEVMKGLGLGQNDCGHR